MRFKKAQEGGGGAAALVAVIGLFVVLYIIMLPPDMRQQILDDTTPVIGENGEEMDDPEHPENTLLLENPGRLYNLGDTQFSHSTPPVRLYTKVNGGVIIETPKMEVKKSIFSDKIGMLDFVVENLENSDNFHLSFLAASGNGVLSIKLNGNQVFSERITRKNVDPIKLPKSLIKEKNNLEFEIEQASFEFWKSSSYNLRDIRVTADLTDDSNTQSSVSFFIDETEKADLKRSELFFSAICDRRKDISVDIFLNGDRIFSGMPDCGNVNKYEVNPGDVKEGKNTLKFHLDKGIVNFNNIRLKNELRKPRISTYYFDVTRSEFDDIIEGEISIGLFLKFAGDENKEARYFVNDFIRAFDTSSSEYFADITPDIREGFNSIEIKPLSTFEIAELRVAKSTRR